MGPQWSDHEQTSRLYDAEDAWAVNHPRLGADQAGDLMSEVVGRRVGAYPVPGLAVRDSLGRAVQELAFTGHEGHLLYNPDMVGHSFRLGDVTHEATHLLGVEGHGTAMASAHLEVVRRALGDEEHRALLGHYRRFRVGF